MFLTIAFYQFVSLKNIEQLQTSILKFCQKNNIKGTVLLASEGINGNISGLDYNIYKLLEFIKTDPSLNGSIKNLEYKES